MVITCRILPVSASSPEKCTCISSCSSKMIPKQVAISKWLASLKRFLPCSHVLASWRSFTPVGQAHEWPCLFNKHKWLHPPLVLELHGLSPVISRQSSYLKNGKIPSLYESVDEWLELWTCNSEVPSSSPALIPSWICSWSSPKFKFLATLVKQPTGLPLLNWDF